MRASGNTTLVTGATGFLGLEIVRSLVREDRPIYVFARGRSPGRAELEGYARAGRVKLLWGDLERLDLGLSPAVLQALKDEVRVVVHSAALYHLSVARERALSVNVAGLRNLLSHASRWKLDAFHYVSSIAAAGDVEGTVEEEVLPAPSRFRNYYEESKAKAEEVILDWARVPLRIYRPGIIMGRSSDGEAQKFDGPYEAFGMIRRWLPFVIPKSIPVPFPVVTVDLVATTIVAGVLHPPAEREFLHVVDLAAPPLGEFFEEVTKRLTGRNRVLEVPEGLFMRVVALPGFERITGLQRAACDYMRLRTRYATTAFAQFAARHAISPRRFPAAYDSLVTYYAMHAGRSLAGRQ